MKFVRVSGIAAILLLLGAMTVAYAQRDDKQGDPSGEKQDKSNRPRENHDKGAPPQQKGVPQVAPQVTPQQRQPEQPPKQAQQPQAPKKEAAQPQNRQPQPTRVQQPAQTQAPQKQAQQPQQQKEQRAQQPQQAHQQPQRTQQQARTWQQQKGWLQQGGGSTGHTTWQQDRTANWGSDHRTWAQRGGYGGYYVPQNSFNLYFGGQHFFRIGTLPVMYLGYPRFEYGGYSFLLLDAYPESWSDNWYASDEVYIDYDDGYYLHDSRYPQIRLAVMIEL